MAKAHFPASYVNMIILDLFSGSGSMSQTFADRGWGVVSSACNVKTDALIKTDILEWERTVFPVGHFDVARAIPRCTHKAAPDGAPKPSKI